MTPPTDAYMRSIAHSLGIPSMWYEDCLQEMRIDLWRSDGNHPVLTCRRSGIDFVRWLKGRRIRKPFVESLSNLNEKDDTLSNNIPDPSVHPTDDLMDAAAELGKLTSREQHLILLKSYGYRLSEIGILYGISFSRVSQIITDAQAKLNGGNA